MNDIEAVVPQLLAQGLLALRNFNMMPMVVNTDYSSEFAEKGDTVDIPAPGPVAVRDVNPGPVPPGAPADDATKIQLPLDQWKEAPFYMTDRDMQAVMNGYIPRKATYAISSLVDTVNAHILRVAALGIPTAIGTAGTTPFGGDVTIATGARRELNKQKAPAAERFSVLDPDAAASALNQRAFQDVSWSANPAAIMDGDIERKFGIRWLEDQQVFTATRGGGAVAAVVNAHNAGVSSLTVDGAGAAGIRAGVAFTIAGDMQPYTATRDIAGGAVTINPPLQQPAADNAVITIAETTVHNVAFSRDCIAFASRPLLAEDGLGSTIMAETDPVTGLTLRLEVSRQHKQTEWSFDLLYGCIIQRPELGVRILG